MVALACLFFGPAINGVAYELPERRKEQRRTAPGHILAPAAANIPGIGFTYGLMAGGFNVRDTEMDLFGFRFWGDLAGKGLGVVDAPAPYPELTFNVFWNDFEKVGIESHRRGIDSNPEDRNIIEMNRFNAYVGQINYRMFERRLQFNIGLNRQEARLAAIRDKEGDVITEGDGATDRSFNRSYGVIVDLTDDRWDPRQGQQIEVYRYDRPDPGGDDAFFYTMEYNISHFIPFGRQSTWAFNLYRSDAVVMREGETDRDTLRQGLGFSCDQLPEGDQRDQCLETSEDFIDEQEASNRHGTAQPLGGTQRLRSYVTNRYFAAHSLFAGTEFRWNLTEEFTPFNIYILSGIRTSVQLAFFIEGGTVADLPENLDTGYKYSYGSGVRFVLASGFVVRFDLASGSEGTQPTLVFQYPWSVF